MKGKLQIIGGILEASEGKFVEIRGELRGMKVTAQGFVKVVDHHSPWLSGDGDMNYEYDASLHDSPKKGSKEVAYYKKGTIYGAPGDVRVTKIWAITCII